MEHKYLYPFRCGNGKNTNVNGWTSAVCRVCRLGGKLYQRSLDPVEAIRKNKGKLFIFYMCFALSLVFVAIEIFIRILFRRCDCECVRERVSSFRLYCPPPLSIHGSFHSWGYCSVPFFCDFDDRTSHSEQTEIGYGTILIHLFIFIWRYIEYYFICASSPHSPSADIPSSIRFLSHFHLNDSVWLRKCVVRSMNIRGCARAAGLCLCEMWQNVASLFGRMTEWNACSGCSETEHFLIASFDA